MYFKLIFIKIDPIIAGRTKEFNYFVAAVLALCAVRISLMVNKHAHMYVWTILVHAVVVYPNLDASVCIIYSVRSSPVPCINGCALVWICCVCVRLQTVFPFVYFRLGSGRIFLYFAASLTLCVTFSFFLLIFILLKIGCAFKVVITRMHVFNYS